MALISAWDDFEDDFNIGKGDWSPQVAHAIEVVADVLNKYPNADIQFTGHSLGGGLASLMAVFFDRPAGVFAPAPFGVSAMNKRAGRAPRPLSLALRTPN